MYCPVYIAVKSRHFSSILAVSTFYPGNLPIEQSTKLSTAGLVSGGRTSPLYNVSLHILSAATTYLRLQQLLLAATISLSTAAPPIDSCLHGPEDVLSTSTIYMRLQYLLHLSTIFCLLKFILPRISTLLVDSCLHGS